MADKAIDDKNFESLETPLLTNYTKKDQFIELDVANAANDDSPDDSPPMWLAHGLNIH
jgi:hypothetical protein